MKKWSRICAVLLMLGVVTGMTASAVQGGDMAVKRSISGHMVSPSPGDCDGCGDNTNSDSCFMLCAAAAPAVLPSAHLLPAVTIVSFIVMPYRFSHGRIFPPDPGPPRSSDVG